MDELEYDVLIIGAGIACCAAALPACRAGMRPFVADIRPEAYAKPCGDGLSPRSIALLAELGIASSRITAAGGHEILRSIHEMPPQTVSLQMTPGTCFTLPRRRLLTLLRQEASGRGAVFLFECHTSPVHDATVWRLPALAKAPSLINAAGCQHGLWADVQKKRSLPVGGTAICRADTRLDSSTFFFWHLSRGHFPAYQWAFPLSDGQWNIGVWGFMPIGQVREEMQYLLNRWERELATATELITPPRYALLGTRSVLGMPGEAGAWYAAGDVAGACDLGSGEGIADAMGGGIHAAELCLGQRKGT